MVTQTTTMGEIRDLAPLSQQLNAATDQLNELLAQIQGRLNALNLGVETWLTNSRDSLDEEVVDEGSENAPRQVECAELGYIRHSEAGWTFAVRYAAYEQRWNGEDWEFASGTPVTVRGPFPLNKCARALRVKAVSLLPALIDQLKREAQGVIDAVERARKIAESFGS